MVVAMGLSVLCVWVEVAVVVMGHVSGHSPIVCLHVQGTAAGYGLWRRVECHVVERVAADTIAYMLHSASYHQMEMLEAVAIVEHNARQRLVDATAVVSGVRHPCGMEVVRLRACHATPRFAVVRHCSLLHLSEGAAHCGTMP